MTKAKSNGHGLRLDPKNARKHSERNQKLVKQSLEKVGAFRSVGADGNGIIRVGNQTYQSAQELGYKIKVVKGKPNELIVVQRDDLKGKDAIRAAVLDNASADSSAYDYDADILAAIAEQDADVAALIKDDPKLAELLASDRVVTDPMAEWQGMPEFHQEDKTAFKSIIVHFDSHDNVKNFAELVAQTITDKTKFIWYPKKERADLLSVVSSEQS